MKPRTYFVLSEAPDASGVMVVNGTRFLNRKRWFKTERERDDELAKSQAPRVYAWAEEGLISHGQLIRGRVIAGTERTVRE